MFIDYDTFRQRADALLHRIASQCRAASRQPAQVTLLPGTKPHPPPAAEYAARFGLVAVGENRVQEAVENRPQTTTNPRWELTGHRQTKNDRLAAAHVER